MDLKHIEKPEFDEISDDLLATQLDKNLILDLKDTASYQNKERRSMTMKTSDNHGAIQKFK